MLDMLQPMTPAGVGFVLLGRPASGQLVATAVDLALRDQLRVRERSGTWVASPTSTGRERGAGTTTYEAALMSWMFGSDRPFLLSELDERRVASLGPVVDRLLGELRRRRLVHPLAPRGRHAGPFDRGAHLTARARELAVGLTRARTQLRSAELEPERMRALFGHLMVLGLCTEARMRAAEPELARLAAFASDWNAAGAELPGWRPPPPEKTEYEPLGPSAPGAFEPGNPLLGGMADGD